MGGALNTCLKKHPGVEYKITSIFKPKVHFLMG